ncbi:MAG: DNA mismatch repair protein MutT [Erythrobacter sp.]|nr:DNA mismatch repair protein MutT [Erythrobacter sp.]
MLHLIPARLHRALLPMAHRLRHHWRRLRGAPIAGCAIIVHDFSGAVLMMRHSYGPAVWALPGGGIGAREQPEQAVRRELFEETGLVAANLALVAVIDEEISGSPHRCYLFSAVCDGLARPDQREVVEARFFPLHSLPHPLGAAARHQLEIWHDWKRSQ